VNINVNKNVNRNDNKNVNRNVIANINGKPDKSMVNKLKKGGIDNSMIKESLMKYWSQHRVSSSMTL